MYSHYNPKRCSGFAFLIESRQWGVVGAGFSIEAGSWGEMVKLVSSFLRAQIKSTLHFCCLPPCFQKPRPLLTHDRSGKRCTGAWDFNIEAGRPVRPSKCFDLAHLRVGACVELVLKPSAAEVMRAQPTMAVGARERMRAFPGVGLMAV